MGGVRPAIADLRPCWRDPVDDHTGGMETNLRLGRVAGIRVGLNWSALVIIWLVVWSLTTGTLPEVAPGHTGGAYLVAGITTAALFFASLLAHELSHSVVARRLGVDVEEITLWMLGGVSKLGSDAEEPNDELAIALAGPACSFGLGLGFGALGSIVGVLGAPELVVAVPSVLGALNLVLAVFNLLPAFPMDGGRVLRAALWRRSGDKRRATRSAAAAGRVLGSALIGLGIFIVMGGGAVSGVWMAFIGLFILFASTVEATQSESDELLAGVTVDDVMSAHPIAAPAHISVAALIDDHVLHDRVSAFPVIDDGQVIGLVTLQRIRSVSVHARPTTAVGAIACPLDHVPLAAPGDPVADLVPRLVASPDRRALVFEGSTLVGIVSSTDIARAIEVHALASGA